MENKNMACYEEANKEVSEKQKEQMKGEKQHIYSTGLNAALQFEHSIQTEFGRQTGSDERGVFKMRWKSQLYRDACCL